MDGSQDLVSTPEGFDFALSPTLVVPSSHLGHFPILEENQSGEADCPSVASHHEYFLTPIVASP
ncbi:hypothetical protein PJI17_32630, partial [Mycobacterium kansasii]